MRHLLSRSCFHYVLRSMVFLIETIKTKKFSQLEQTVFIFFVVELLASRDCYCLIFS